MTPTPALSPFDEWRATDDQIREWAERHDLRGSLTELREIFDDARTLAASPQGVPAGTAEDANNYCRILTLLGMEEEGDPVAEVERLVAAQGVPVQAEPVAPEGWKLVPIEPTYEMLVADWNVSMSDAHTETGVAYCAWQAMLGASPQAAEHPGAQPDTEVQVAYLTSASGGNDLQTALPEQPSRRREDWLLWDRCYARQSGKDALPFLDCVSLFADVVRNEAVRDQFTDGVNAAAAMLDKKADDYAAEHSTQDGETGVWEFGRHGEDHYNTLRELADDIRSIVLHNLANPSEAA